MLGFKFKNVHSSAFGVVKTINKPVLPSVKTVEVTPSFMDGTIDYSDYNSKGRYFYSDRIFEITLQVKAVSIQELIEKLDKVKSWLFGKGELIFDDIPERIWEARIIQGVDFAPQILGRFAELKVSFRVPPYAKGIYRGTQQFSLNSGENTVKFTNNSTFYIEPIVIYNGAGLGTYIKVNDFELRTEELKTKRLAIDNNVKEVYNYDRKEENFTQCSNFKFFELAPGENELKVITDNIANLWIDFTPLYL